MNYLNNFKKLTVNKEDEDWEKIFSSVMTRKNFFPFLIEVHTYITHTKIYINGFKKNKGSFETDYIVIIILNYGYKEKEKIKDELKKYSSFLGSNYMRDYFLINSSPLSSIIKLVILEDNCLKFFINEKNYFYVPFSIDKEIKSILKKLFYNNNENLVLLELYE